MKPNEMDNLVKTMALAFVELSEASIHAAAATTHIRHLKEMAFITDAEYATCKQAVVRLRKLLAGLQVGLSMRQDHLIALMKDEIKSVCVNGDFIDAAVAVEMVDIQFGN